MSAFQRWLVDQNQSSIARDISILPSQLLAPSGRGTFLRKLGRATRRLLTGHLVIGLHRCYRCYRAYRKRPDIVGNSENEETVAFCDSYGIIKDFVSTF